MRKMSYLFLALCFLSGCATAGSHLDSVKSDVGDRITVGRVQREIHIGMPSAQVIEALGAPNIVSTDENRLEVWVYDKIATDVSYSTSKSGAGVWLLVMGVGGSGSSGAKSTSQRTLTIVIKFDKESRVRDFAYHSSSF